MLCSNLHSIYNGQGRLGTTIKSLRRSLFAKTVCKQHKTTYSTIVKENAGFAIYVRGVNSPSNLKIIRTTWENKVNNNHIVSSLWRLEWHPAAFVLNALILGLTKDKKRGFFINVEARDNGIDDFFEINFSIWRLCGLHSSRQSLYRMFYAILVKRTKSPQYHGVKSYFEWAILK